MSANTQKPVTHFTANTAVVVLLLFGVAAQHKLLLCSEELSEI